MFGQEQEPWEEERWQEQEPEAGESSLVWDSELELSSEEGITGIRQII